MFSEETFIKRRDLLKDKVKSGIILLPGNDISPMDAFANCYPFRQNDSFIYFTGLNKVEKLTLIIDIDNNKEILFGDDLTVEDQIWTGAMPSVSTYAQQCGIKTVKKISELKPIIDNFRKQNRTIHFLPSCRSETLINLAQLLDIPAHEINKNISKRLIRAVVALREIKSEEEVTEIVKAHDISHEIYSTLIHSIKPGFYERELNGKIENILASHNSSCSFPTILTIKGKTFHNSDYCNLLKKGDLLLLDSGAKSPCSYASDITRTYPVSGKFTDKQKDIYNIVLKAQIKSIEKIKPNVLYKDIHLHAATVIAEGLKNLGLMKGNIEDAVSAGAHALFFPHGLGHMLGIEDHDMESLGEDYVGYTESIKRSSQFGLAALRLAKELKPGFVLTAEPGIYFIPNLIDKWQSENKLSDFINYDKVNEYRDFEGIRIEDDILVTDRGYKILGKSIPKDVSEIESIMQ
jgi:Xaa-Pro dipeptidase